MNLAVMQSMLGRIYDTPIRHPVEDFLLTDRALLPAGALPAAEQLLVSSEGDTVYLSLFVDAAVLARLASGSEPWYLSSENLADWLTALEGVSHFQYLTYHAGFDRQVSLLELELQAEVDKYVSCLEVLRVQAPGRFPSEVLPQLFSSRFQLDPQLPAHLTARYLAATRGAARFCGRLDRSLQRQRDWKNWLRELRRFYRWPVSRKLALIEALN
jgi:hypothetical protein